MNGSSTNPAHTTGLAALFAAAIVGTVVYLASIKGAHIPVELTSAWTAVLTAGFGYLLHNRMTAPIAALPAPVAPALAPTKPAATTAPLV